MSTLPTTQTRAQVTTLEQRLREIGLVLMQCDRHGRMCPQRSTGRDWLCDLVQRSTFVTRGLSDAVAQWNAEDQPMPFEVVSGLWLAAVPTLERRERVGYVIAAIPTSDLLIAAPFEAMCQAARLDATMARRMLEGLRPPNPSEVIRLATLFRFNWNDQQVIDSNSTTLESVGQELGETYEEINLLYTIIQGMTVVERPDRFIAFACEELLHTLPYRWIAAWVSPRTATGSAELIVAGTPGRERGAIETAARTLTEVLDAGSACVVDGHPSAGSLLSDLGVAAMAQPISRDGRVHGMLVAGAKQGSDSSASSVDMKLLGAAASHMAIFLENAGLYEDLNAMFLGTLEALTASIDAKDRYTCGHSRRVALLTRQLAASAGLDEATVARMHIAGLVHDVGKIGVSEQVLSKPGDLTDDEYALIREHPRIGWRILRDIPRFDDILDGVLHHHERWDGRGYPDGLAGQNIPLVGRLIALADAYDAMCSTRTYRAAMSRDAVLKELAAGAGRQFDPDLVPLFLDLDFTGYERMVDGHYEADARRQPADRGSASMGDQI